nr:MULTISPECIES: endolytic transglycosylase MltG [unclassified Mycobacteroides]
MTRRERARQRAQARRRRNAGLAGLALVVIITVAAVVGGAKLWDSLFGADAPTTDYSGAGLKDFVFEVHPGDTTKVIGQRLKEEGVVATPSAFTDAAQGNAAIAAIQPGFYKLRTKIPGKDAVARLAEQESRVGLLVIPEGRQLDDVAAVGNGAVTEGIFTLIARASCVDLDGDKHCVAASDLRQAATTASQSELAVPEWASNGVNAVRDDHRRIEGLIAAGRWDFNPMAEPEQILASLIRESDAQYRQLGLLDADAAGLSPYEVVVVASLLQREAKPRDFAKVARVVYNRLAVHQKLEFDSTVNYPLDRQEIATTDDDRGRKTLWNTYVSQGLPATPICSPSPEALRAAEHPEPGDWLYFVTIDAEGTTLFTADYNEHLANIELAKKNGILDSAR